MIQYERVYTSPPVLALLVGGSRWPVGAGGEMEGVRRHKVGKRTEEERGVVVEAVQHAHRLGVRDLRRLLVVGREEGRAELVPLGRGQVLHQRAELIRGQALEELVLLRLG